MCVCVCVRVCVRARARVRLKKGEKESGFFLSFFSFFGAGEGMAGAVRHFIHYTSNFTCRLEANTASTAKLSVQ